MRTNHCWYTQRGQEESVPQGRRCSGQEDPTRLPSQLEGIWGILSGDRLVWRRSFIDLDQLIAKCGYRGAYLHYFRRKINPETIKEKKMSLQAEVESLKCALETAGEVLRLRQLDLHQATWQWRCIEAAKARRREVLMGISRSGQAPPLDMPAVRAVKKVERLNHVAPAKAAGRPAIVPVLDMAAVRAVQERDRLDAEAFELMQAEACEAEARELAAEQGDSCAIGNLAEETYHIRREAAEDISRASSSFYSSDTDSDGSSAADRDVESNVDCHEMDSPTPPHGTPSTGGASLPRNLNLKAFAGSPPSAKTLCLSARQKQEALAIEPTPLALYYASGMKTGKLGTAGSVDAHKTSPATSSRPQPTEKKKTIMRKLKRAFGRFFCCGRECCTRKD